MKKNVIMASAIALIFAGLYSCSSDEKSIEMSSSPNTEMNSAFAKLGDSYVLFTYSTDFECEKGTEAAASQLVKDTYDELNGLTGVDQIVTRMTVGNGEGVVSEIHYLDNANSTIVKSLILNPVKGGYDTINIGVPFNQAPNVPTGGPCPEGWTHLGDCIPGSPNYGECIGTATVNYQTSHLGKTNTYTYTTPPGSNTTTICAQSVKPK